MRSVITKVRIPAPLLSASLLAAASAALGSAAVTPWWALPAAVCAFLAGRRPGRGRSAAAALAAVTSAAVVAVLLEPAWLGRAGRFAVLLLFAGMLPWFAGRFLRQYRELVRAGWERAARLEREQRLVAQQARLRERTRIAQDMHDLLGHELSLIALSAGALKLAPGLPEQHRAAAQDIRARAGAAVDRLGEVIGVLREPSGPAAPPDSADSAGSGAGPGALEDLVERAAAAGLDVRLHVSGSRTVGGAVPRAVERAAHRVVQEALTNVAKHAPGHRATVSVRYGQERTEVGVSDGPSPDAPAARGARSAPGASRDPAPRSAPGASRDPAPDSDSVSASASVSVYPFASVSASGEGHRFGLIGLDERVRLAGGVFAAGPAGRGFAVRATLPHRAGAAALPLTDSGGPGVALPPEHRSARRRLGRTATAAVLVPLCTGTLLIGGARVWDTVTARQSVLAPRDYASLTPGQSREEVAPLLPERRSARRPAVPVPVPPGTACEFYVQTADPFDDRSGDLYRLCFRAGRLVSADTFTGKDVR